MRPSKGGIRADAPRDAAEASVVLPRCLNARLFASVASQTGDCSGPRELSFGWAAAGPLPGWRTSRPQRLMCRVRSHEVDCAVEIFRPPLPSPFNVVRSPPSHCSNATAARTPSSPLPTRRSQGCVSCGGALGPWRSTVSLTSRACSCAPRH